MTDKDIKTLLNARWITTTQRLPEDDIICWVFSTKSQSIEKCCFNTHHECWDGESGDDFMLRTDQVSHWQPYIEPSPPSG